MAAVVLKALSLLRIFTESTPEYGLSDLSRLAQIDKATTHRMLKDLCEAGLLEQNPRSKLYRLGAGLLLLARAREVSFPFVALVQPLLDELAEETGETAHCSIYNNLTLTVLGAAESKKANRVSMRGSETLPFHATASGIAFLAFSERSVVSEITTLPRPAFTTKTSTEMHRLEASIAQAQGNGFAVVDGDYEDDVYGVAVPIFGQSQAAMGALAVATPSHRLTTDLHNVIVSALLSATISLAKRLGNEPPASYLEIGRKRTRHPSAPNLAR